VVRVRATEQRKQNHQRQGQQYGCGETQLQHAP
jgi:hypothetical protein